MKQFAALLVIVGVVGASVGCARDRALEPPPNAGPPQDPAHPGYPGYASMNGFTMPSGQAPNPSQPNSDPWAANSMGANSMAGPTGLPATSAKPAQPVSPSGTPFSPPNTASAAPSLPAAALPPPESSDSADLFKAQDACLSSCDQFACMKIANAYREGLGLPKDVLAGRRYAIHACIECGKAGPGIERECPTYQLPAEERKPN